jgi:hypothetical protein
MICEHGYMRDIDFSLRAYCAAGYFHFSFHFFFHLLSFVINVRENKTVPLN